MFFAVLSEFQTCGSYPRFFPPLNSVKFYPALPFPPFETHFNPSSSAGTEVCQLMPWTPANWCPESLTGALEIADCSADQTAISRAPVRLSEHRLPDTMAQYYEHLYVCGRSMVVPWKQGQSTTKQYFIMKEAL